MISALAVAMPTPPAPTMPTRSPAMRARAYGADRARFGARVQVSRAFALVQCVPEPSERDADPGLGGAEGDLVLFGDLSRAETPHPGEHHGAALLRRKIGERRLQPLEVVVQRDDVARVPARSRRGEAQQLVGRDHDGPALADGVDGDVPGDAQEPAVDAPPPDIEGVGVAPGADHRLLGGVLRRPGIAQHGEGEPVHPPLVAGHEGGGRRRVRCREPGQEHLVEGARRERPVRGRGTAAAARTGSVRTGERITTPFSSGNVSLHD